MCVCVCVCVCDGGGGVMGAVESLSSKCLGVLNNINLKKIST